MARFDVYRPRGEAHLLLDCQGTLVAPLPRRFVVPLMPALDLPMPIPRLHPRFLFDGHRWTMATHLAASVPIPELGARVGTLIHEQDRIMDALDMLLTGF